jgi:hypothetical protein
MRLALHPHRIAAAHHRLVRLAPFQEIQSMSSYSRELFLAAVAACALIAFVTPSHAQGAEKKGALQMAQADLAVQVPSAPAKKHQDAMKKLPRPRHLEMAKSISASLK